MPDKFDLETAQNIGEIKATLKQHKESLNDIQRTLIVINTHINEMKPAMDAANDWRETKKKAKIVAGVLLVSGATAGAGGSTLVQKIIHALQGLQ